MLNDDDKDKGFESQEESEYHFSDDEANYEVEPEPEPAKPETPKEEGSKASFLNKFTQSKRMLISGGVFILLIFVVYKMVTPTSTSTPSTDIMMATPSQTAMPKTGPTAQASTQVPSEMASSSSSVSAGNLPPQDINQPSGEPIVTSQMTMPSQMTAQTVGVTQQPAVSASGVPMQQSTAGFPAPGGGTQVMTPPVASTPLTQTTVGQTSTPGTSLVGNQVPQTVVLPSPGASGTPAGSAITQTSSAVMSQANQAIQQGVELAKTSLPMTSSMIPPGTPGTPTQTTAGAAAINKTETVQSKNAEQNTIVGMPAVIPVQSPIPTTVATIREQALAAPTSLAQMGALQTPLVEKAQTDLASLQSKSEQLMNQLQAEYARKLDEYSSQNKALQNEMQNLNAKVAGLESQLSQLLQALMRPHETAPPVAPREAETGVVEQRMTYNVQAIIPGRAWLKSQSGETVTVAEGDVVRDLGRITKIDPYDGVVEINTGNKVVALSYGNGG